MDDLTKRTSFDFDTRSSEKSGAPDVAEWPKITLVTPVRNAVRYIEQAIRSVVFQGYPNLEYMIVDGGSTDGTTDIVQRYARQLSWWVSEPDGGMYHALNKAFARSSGEIMGWINATDILHTRSLFTVGSVFRSFPEVEWITGVPTHVNEDGTSIRVSELRRWSRTRFLAGSNQYVTLGFPGLQQESTLWRRSLWVRSGGCLSTSVKHVGDFELWVRFFRYARLYSVEALIGGYRSHPDSLGVCFRDETHVLYKKILDAEIKSVPGGHAIKAFRSLNGFIERLPKIRALWWRLILTPLYRSSGADLPPVIAPSEEHGWVFRG